MKNTVSDGIDLFVIDLHEINIEISSSNNLKNMVGDVVPSTITSDYWQY